MQSLTRFMSLVHNLIAWCRGVLFTVGNRKVLALKFNSDVTIAELIAIHHGW